MHESDDLANLLSNEVSLLSHTDTEAVFLKKYIDKTLLTLQYEDKRLVKSEHQFTEVHQKVRRKEKGPFKLCVDTSMSMEGKPEEIARERIGEVCLENDQHACNTRCRTGEKNSCGSCTRTYLSLPKDANTLHRS